MLCAFAAVLIMEHPYPVQTVRPLARRACKNQGKLCHNITLPSVLGNVVPRPSCSYAHWSFL